jgi:ABC-type antimicrobial peptide transport system permease subunit
MQGIHHDLKIAFRNIRTKPSFSLMVIGMLAAGIAGNAAIFSIFNAMFLRPLPFAESDRLIELDDTAPKWNLKYVGVSVPDFYEWRKSNSTFDSMAFFTGASYNLNDRETTQRVQGAQVTRDMLSVLRLKPLIGRNFRPEEDKPGGAKVVLLNYALWQRIFRGERNVLGRVVKLDEQAYTVIGVLPPAAVFPDRADLWTPLVGVPLGLACLRALVSRMAEQMPQWITFSLDWRFAIFCVTVTGAAALLFGLIPVLQASRLDIRGSLQAAATRATATRGRHATLGAFVVCEISLALMLSVGAGLLVEAFRKVLHVDPGFRPENVLTFGISLPDETYGKPEQKVAYYDNLLAQLRELPGV